MRFLALFLACSVLWSCSSQTLAHDDAQWIQDGAYQGPDGIHCCGPKDCFPLADDDVEVKPGGYFIKSLDEFVPATDKGVHVSQDGHFWRCKKWDGSRRCFFIPGWGS